jgi:hypothetical protein
MLFSHPNHNIDDDNQYGSYVKDENNGADVLHNVLLFFCHTRENCCSVSHQTVMKRGIGYWEYRGYFFLQIQTENTRERVFFGGNDDVCVRVLLCSRRFF